MVERENTMVEGDALHHRVAHVSHGGWSRPASTGPRRSTRPHGGGAVHHRAQEPVEQRDTQALDQAQHSQAQVRDHVRLLDERGKQVPLQNVAHEENCRAVQQGDEALEG